MDLLTAASRIKKVLKDLPKDRAKEILALVVADLDYVPPEKADKPRGEQPAHLAAANARKTEAANAQRQGSPSLPPA